MHRDGIVEDMSWHNIAYFGDADNDLECMMNAGISGCPNDAFPHIKEKVDFVSKLPGGSGCFYDFVRNILLLIGE